MYVACADEKRLYTKTYGGSLGLLPVFMLAVYFTLIILYGALWPHGCNTIPRR